MKLRSFDLHKESIPFLLFGAGVLLSTLISYLNCKVHYLVPDVCIGGLFLLQPISGITTLLFAIFGTVLYAAGDLKGIRSLAHPRWAIFCLLFASLLIVVMAIWEPSMNLKLYRAGIIARFGFTCFAICAGTWLSSQLWKSGMTRTAIANAVFWFTQAWFFVQNAMTSGVGIGIVGVGIS